MSSCNLLLLAIAIAIAIFSSASLLPPAFAADDVLYSIFPFIRVYKNGRVERFIGKDVVPPSAHDPTTGVQSKDVKLSSILNVSARLYLPRNPTPARRIPLLIYFHGGGFFTESAFSPTYHNFLNSLVAKANVIAVSVNYRLAPEHPLPAAYQDSWLAVEWAFSHLSGKGNEAWLTNYADFGRVYLGGDSAGGNIANQIGIRMGLGRTDPRIKISGMFLDCPFFWGKRAIGNESVDGKQRDFYDALWVHAYPGSSGLDDPLLNPGMDPNLKILKAERVLVYVAGNDPLRYRGWYYGQVLKRSGWNGVVKVVEFAGEDHVFNLISPTTPKAILMLKSVAYFLNH